MIVVAFSAAPLRPGDGWLMVPAVVAYLVGAAVLSRANTAIYLRSAGRDGRSATAALKRHNSLALLTRAWLLVGLAALMLLGYGRWVNDALGLGSVPLIGSLAAVLPFVAGVLLVWIGDYPFHRAVRQARRRAADRSGGNVWTLGQYLAFNTRHHLLFVAVPVGIIILAADGLGLLIPRVVSPHTADYLVPAAVVLSAGLVFAFAPLLVVRIWKTQRLPDGAFRRRLEETCRRLGLKYRDILLWQSGGVIANAAVLGFIPPARYILISDALSENMSPGDIEAIFAHEAGHILYHHIFYAALFTVGVMNLCALAGYTVALVVGWGQWVGNILALMLMAAVWGTSFGYVSRLFERQSDVTAAWASGRHGEGDDPDLITHEGAAIFARALQRVGELNGIPAWRRSWRHGSTARRISYILWLGSTAATRRRDNRLVRRVKAATWVIFLVSVGAGVAADAAGWL